MEHYADDYEEVVELKNGNQSSLATRDSNALQYFALEAYAFDVVVPGEGCSGDEQDGEGSKDDGHADEEKEEQKEDEEEEEEDIPEV